MSLTAEQLLTRVNQPSTGASQGTTDTLSVEQRAKQAIASLTSESISLADCRAAADGISDAALKKAVLTEIAAAKCAAKSDPAIESLNLSEKARSAAYLLKELQPSVTFTSGRRDKAEQARAMAGNVVGNRNWIKDTYTDSEASRACQKWVDEHPEAKTSTEIEAGLLSVLNGFTDAQLAGLSKHLSGDAFDVQPVTGTNGTQIKDSIKTLPGLSKFLDTEGGKTVWHAQF